MQVTTKRETMTDVEREQAREQVGVDVDATENDDGGGRS
jgi:hypothetical protein